MKPNLVNGQETSSSPKSRMTNNKLVNDGEFEGRLRFETAVKQVVEQDPDQEISDSDYEAMECVEKSTNEFPVVFGLTHQQSSQDSRHYKFIQTSSDACLEGRSLDQSHSGSEYRTTPSESLLQQINSFGKPEGNVLEKSFQSVSEGGLPPHLTLLNGKTREHILSGSHSHEFATTLGLKAYGEENKIETRSGEKPVAMGEEIHIASASSLTGSIETKMLNSLQDVIFGEVNTGKLRQSIADATQLIPVWNQTSSPKSFRIKLLPEHLGTLSLALHSSNEGMNISIQADSLEAAAKLALVGEELMRSLESAGISVTQITIEPLHASSEATFIRKEASEQNSMGSQSHFQSGGDNMEHQMSGGRSKQSHERKDTLAPIVEDFKDGTYI